MDKSVDISQRCVYLSLQPRQVRPTGDHAYEPEKGEYYNERINTTNQSSTYGIRASVIENTIPQNGSCNNS